jgi:SAM-dependent methyltransferase
VDPEPIDAGTGPVPPGLSATVYRTSAPPQRLTAAQERFRDAVLAKLNAGDYALEAVRYCLCGSQDAVPVADRDRFGLPVGVVVCSACGLARTSPRLTQESLPRFYDEDYHGLHIGVPDPAASTSLFRRGHGRVIYSLLERSLPARQLRVAEVGCGTGQVLREFIAAGARRGREMTGIGCEFASAYVEAGRDAGTTIRQGGPETLRDDAPFDVVILSHVVEHFTDVPGELAQISHLVATDGLVYVEVPGILTIDAKAEYEYEFGQYLTLAHTYHFSLDTLVDAMNRAGFTLVFGDEETRSVFRRAPRRVERSTGRGAAVVLEYLDSLDRSRSLPWKRAALRARRGVVTHAQRAARSVLPNPAYRIVRGLFRSLTGRR